MEKRQKKIKEIESLIEKNRGLRREFISSFGKISALGAIAALGLTSLLSCEKEYFDEEDDKNNGNSLKSICTSHECIVDFICPIVPEFICMNGFSCYNSSCGDESLFTCDVGGFICSSTHSCNVGEFICSSTHSHNGGSGS